MNKMFLVLPKGVYDPQNKKYWSEFENHTSGIIHKKKVFGIFRKRIYKYLSYPEFAYLDSKDKWWICANFGEFGGDAQIFDTKNEKIYANKFEGIDPGLLFPKSVFEDKNGNVFIASGIQHMFSSGNIYKIATQLIV